VSRFIDAQGEIAVLVERLQQERFQATRYVAAGRQGDVGPLELAGADVDNAGAAARPVVQALYEDDQNLVGAHRQAEQALARLPGLRNLVTTSNAPPSAVVSRYSDLIGQIVQLDDTLLRGVNTAEASGLATALAGLTLARNEASLQSSLVDVAARTDELLGSDLAELQNSQARLQQGLNDFRGRSTPVSGSATARSSPAPPTTTAPPWSTGCWPARCRTGRAVAWTRSPRPRSTPPSSVSSTRPRTACATN
jgi:hypothetical protein